VNCNLLVQYGEKDTDIYVRDAEQNIGCDERMSKKNPYLGNMDMYLEDLELNANLILSFKNWKGKTALINNQVAIINDLINAIREDLNIKKRVMQG